MTSTTSAPQSGYRGVNTPYTRGVYNFSAGPGALPEPVLAKAQEDLWDLFGTKIGILEHSHRGPAYDRVLEEAIADCRRIADISEDYAVLFVQGGATTQAFMAPANLLADGRTADYFDTGLWATEAIAEVHHYGTAHIAGSSKATGYDRIPDATDIAHSDNPQYIHFVSNNTVMGTEWSRLPETPGESYLLCDASSNIFSRPIRVEDYGVLYAGGQKNLGPAGTVLVIARRDIIRDRVRDLPTLMKYDLLDDKQSRSNTPPTFGVYLMGQVFKWILSWESAPGAGDHLQQIESYNRAKAAVIYDAIDASDFWVPGVRKQDRSQMNIRFRTHSAELDEAFISEAAAAGMDGLRGHRTVGGMRASVYNAFPAEGCRELAEFMREFERTHG